MYPRPIWVSVSSKVKFVCGLWVERRKIPRAISTRLRHKVCKRSLPKLFPLLKRLLTEYGRATPTRKVKDGWIMS